MTHLHSKQSLNVCIFCRLISTKKDQCLLIVVDHCASNCQALECVEVGKSHRFAPHQQSSYCYDGHLLCVETPSIRVHDWENPLLWP